MTEPQLRLYRAEWGKARKALRARGWAPALADAERKAIHVRVLGEDVSSLLLNNRQLDLVLGAFRAISSPAALAPQLDEADQPCRRRRWLIAKLCEELGHGGDYAQAVAVSMNREGKLGKRGVFDLDELNEDELDKIIVALKKQVRREGKKKQRAAREAEAQESAEAAESGGDENPF